MPSRPTKSAFEDPHWRTLLRVAGIAAIVAAIVLRRNIAAEITLFTSREPPASAIEWFDLLASHRLLGLASLNVFDVGNYVLIAVVFIALYVLLRRVSQSTMIVATVLGLVGITVYCASNMAFSMLSLSQQFTSAATESQRNELLSAGQALLSINPFGGSNSHPGSGGYTSLLLIAVAGLLMSAVMLRSADFGRLTGYLGIGANALDLAYCVGILFVSAEGANQLAVIFIPAAGLLHMIWHILIGIRLTRTANRLARPDTP